MLPVIEDDARLIESLRNISQNSKGKKLVSSSVYSAPADSSIMVRSWKMNEWKYYDIPSPFPTLARGLFTSPVNANDEGAVGRRPERIVARGYDKFFNIGEVPWTTWSALQEHTAPPYDLTVKSNGCIIFMAALSKSKLLVTSKHSLGPVEGQPESHAQAGERWLKIHLELKGKTMEVLAKTLWENNWTAVAELCDDSFEEHVLPYPDHLTGLHLHGLNTNTGSFTTQPSDVVTTFAKEWGFIPTAYITLDTIQAVREFTEEVGKTGKWRGDAVEGFVVRTRIADAASTRDAPPYAPGTSFFFKVKFDEPYMMYRDWREITRKLLSARSKTTSRLWASDVNLPKAKMQRPETRVYKEWVVKEIEQNPKAFEGFQHGHGIIATRERFLKWCQGKDGAAATDREIKQEEEQIAVVRDPKRWSKTIIVPVAVPGCGKTSLAVALSHLFGFGHTQSDDVAGKKPAAAFVQNVVNLTKTHDVVIADRNNHLRQHRHQIKGAFQSRPGVRVIALNWSLWSHPLATIHRIVSDRVVLRGANHQTLRPEEGTNHEEVVWMFLHQAEELGDGEVDAIIEMDVEESFEDSLNRAINGLVPMLGIQKPSQEKIGEAVAMARAYQAKARKDDKKSRSKGPRYFGLLPEFGLEEVVGSRLKETEAPKSAKRIWEALKAENRVTSRPHVTITHFVAIDNERPLWDRCGSLQVIAEPPMFTFRVGHLVWNDSIMALTVDDLKADGNEEGEKFLNELGDVAQRLHVTVGTLGDAKPVDAGTLVSRWRAGEDVQSLELKDVTAQGRIKGLF